jgi:SAM-dependent methyltransferase
MTSIAHDAHVADRDQTAYWDDFFRRIDAGAPDLDWGGCWTEPFIPLLRAAGAHDLLELGCGTGHDAARMAAAGLRVVAVDLSAEAIGRAQHTYGGVVDFRVADMATGLPFAPASFDAVMANVSVHMFPDTVTRSIFDDVRSIVRPNGLFLFHVNALDDRPLRERARPIARELEPNYVLEQAGQTVRYFSQPYLLDLLADWQTVSLTHRELERTHANASFQKRVWCAVARKGPGVTPARAMRSSRRSPPPECSYSPAE